MLAARGARDPDTGVEPVTDPVAAAAARARAVRIVLGATGIAAGATAAAILARLLLGG